MMVCGTIERMRRAEARLLEHPGVSAVGTGPHEWAPDAEVALHRTEYAERDLSIVDILPAGCSKGSALTRLAARRDMRMEEILAIGDNWNDVSMLEAAGRAVLMANAPEDLKERAVRWGGAWAGGSMRMGWQWRLRRRWRSTVTRSLQSGRALRMIGF